MSIASIDLTQDNILSINRNNSISNLRNSMNRATEMLLNSTPVVKVSFETVEDNDFDIAVSTSNISLHSLWDNPQVMLNTLLNNFAQTKDIVITYNGVKMTKEKAMDLFYISHCEFCLQKLTKEEKTKQELLCENCNKIL